MRDFIYSLMTDKKNGFFYDIFKFKLYLVSLIYGFAIAVRRVFYKFGIFKMRKAPLKVISVGNITLGGTGKTPFVVTLGHILESELKKNACVLIRGYGWDEQAMLKNKLTDIPVLVGEDRARSALKAVKLYGSNTAILDDGFQHWELGRDLDIVLVDSRNPFGNLQLFPRGVLREPKKALQRADIIVFTKTDGKNINLENLKAEAGNINRTAVFLEAVHKPTYLYENKTRITRDLSYVKGKRVILFSSIGDPSHFEETVRAMGAEVVEHIKFTDHHNYKKSDIEHILKRCSERSFDFVLTTEKDIVKLNRLGLYIGSYTVMVVVINLEITLGKEILIDRLNRLYTR
ncbi:MAG: tetraacyldisaccharide 4'-kinase [Candidatus Omnitrophota bacterium]|nr:tetraacyldisaccharide 4'-kinase [Candidatus Omnitrophota bacterium]